MTEQGLWVGRKTGREIGGLGPSPHNSFDIISLSLFHNGRVNDVAIKIHGTCLLHLQWSMCPPLCAGIIVIEARTRATMLLTSCITMRCT